MSIDFVYKCPCCERVMTGLPAFTFQLPDYAHAIPIAERAARVEADAETCIVDGEHYFLRSWFTVPIVGETEELEYGVWGTVSEANFNRYQEAERTGAALPGPMFSWFGSRLPLYEPSTLGLRSQLVTEVPGQRPRVAFHPDEAHPLAQDIRGGVSRERVIAIAALMLPKH